MSNATTSPEAHAEPMPDQLEFSPLELLTEAPYEEPLIADGVRCHGGFVDDRYVSPRGRFRGPAIENWQGRLRAEGHPLVHLPTDYVPPHYPNYAQAKLLLQEGMVDPVTRSLTTISIVEGFGARIRDVPLPDLRGEIVEDLGGTALAHLGSGLFEAHARDEAGHRDQGGHKQMWEAARDLGLARPEIPGDVLLRLMSGQRPRDRGRRFPGLTERMEALITIMATVMIVEIFAEDVFEWAKKLLGDPEVSADPKAAAAMVANIQADEKPHVEYLRTALSELRVRTLLGADGKTKFSGAEVVDTIFEANLRGMVSNRPQQEREAIQQDFHASIAQNGRAAHIARRFEDLDSGWVFPKQEDEELDLLLATA